MLRFPLAAAGVGVAAWAVRGRSSSVFGPSIWRGPTDGNRIALTFDDGPSPSTPDILRILAQYRAAATFFQCGKNVLRYPGIAGATANAGHEIGNHSHTHPLFAGKSPAFIQQDFHRAQQAIIEATGASPALLRAPFGVRWFGFEGMQRQLGLTGVMWTVIGRDWKRPARDIAGRVVNGSQPGGIICLHDGRGLEPNPNIGNTAEALRQIIPALLERGYRFQTVSNLLCPTTN